MAELDKATIAMSKDIVAGGVITAFAVGFGALAWGYPFGAPTQMGPGFFPLLLAGLLACLGVGVTMQGLLVSAEPMALVGFEVKHSDEPGLSVATLDLGQHRR